MQIAGSTSKATILSEIEEPRYTLDIYAEDAGNPRDWDNMFTILTWERRSYSPDTNPFDTPQDFLAWWHGHPGDPEGYDALDPDCDGGADCESGEVANSTGGFLFDVWKYEHSLVRFTASTRGNPFIGRAQHAEWDSGQVGFAYITAEKLASEGFHVPPSEAQLLDWLNGELELYTSYCNGDMWAFILRDNLNETEDSCAGFFGCADEPDFDTIASSLYEVDISVEDLRELVEGL